MIVTYTYERTIWVSGLVALPEHEEALSVTANGISRVAYSPYSSFFLGLPGRLTEFYFPIPVESKSGSPLVSKVAVEAAGAYCQITDVCLYDRDRPVLERSGVNWGFGGVTDRSMRTFALPSPTVVQGPCSIGVRVVFEPETISDRIVEFYAAGLEVVRPRLVPEPDSPGDAK